MHDFTSHDLKVNKKIFSRSLNDNSNNKADVGHHYEKLLDISWSHVSLYGAREWVGAIGGVYYCSSNNDIYQRYCI